MPLRIGLPEVPCVRCHERVAGLAWGERCPTCHAERKRRASQLARRISLVAALMAAGLLGWRFPVEHGPLAFAEIEADWLEIRPVWHWINDAPAVGSLRLQAGLKLAPHVVLLGGAGANVAVATGGRDADLARGPQSVQHSGDTTVRIYPGLMLGLQI